jgi:dCMP deaminase
MDTASALGVAYAQAHRSPDPSTQNGAVVVVDGTIVGVGCNRFPAGIAETAERWNDRPTKYAHVVHAEVAATIDALRHHADIESATLYVVWYACTDCAKVIIASGIRRVVGHEDHRRFAEEHHPGWTDSITTALAMLGEAGVECDWHSGPVDAEPVRISGQLFDPR